MDYRDGLEKKSWLARAGQTSLYLDRAHSALEIVKVVSTISSLS